MDNHSVFELRIELDLEVGSYRIIIHYHLIQIGDFKDLGEIGKGGYGRVIKALHKIDQRIYAIKVIKLPLNSAHNDLRKAFKREVTMLSQLDHENVVRYVNR